MSSLKGFNLIFSSFFYKYTIPQGLKFSYPVRDEIFVVMNYQRIINPFRDGKFFTYN
jgi:hypothetical protein